ncbi:MAG: hypothetical protein AB7G93_07060 [Bdellovibrionales bacterium]
MREILSQLASFGYAVSRDELEQTVRDTNQRQSAYYANRTARGRAVNPEMSDRTGIGDQFNQYSISLIRLLTRKMGTSGPEDWAITFKENSLEFGSGEAGFRDLDDVIRSCERLLGK